MVDFDYDAIETQDVTRYSSSITTHIFDVMDINGKHKLELEAILNDVNIGNGDFKAWCCNSKISAIEYQTSDSYEFDEIFAEELSMIVAGAISALASEIGSYSALSK